MNTNLAQKNTQNQVNNPLNQQSSFKRVLVAIDNIINSTEIFDQAVDLAEQFHGRLLICHCVSNNNLPSSPELFTLGGMSTFSHAEIWELEEEAIEQASKKIQAEFNFLQDKAQAKGISTESTYLSGNPGEEICNLAKSWQADIIVLGRRGLSGLSEMFFGSVSNYVFHHAPCAVLIVQHNEQEEGNTDE